MYYSKIDIYLFIDFINTILLRINLYFFFFLMFRVQDRIDWASTSKALLPVVLLML